MVTANPMPDGFVPTQDPPVRDAADETAVIHKFKNLQICDHSTSAEEGGGPDPMLITRQFKELDISGGHGQMDNNSAEATAAMRSRTGDPLTMLSQIMFELENQNPETPFDLTADFIIDSEPDLSKPSFEVDDVDDWWESAMRYAVPKWRKERTRTLRKRLSKGPIRNKVGGVSRHRHNASRHLG